MVVVCEWGEEVKGHFKIKLYAIYHIMLLSNGFCLVNKYLFYSWM